MSRIEPNRTEASCAGTSSAELASAASSDALSEHERQMLQALRDTAFGTVEVTVHQSRIVQITRSEKLRL